MRKSAMRSVVAGAVLLLAAGVTGHGQHTQPGQMPLPIQATPTTTRSGPDPAVREAEARQANMRNEDRQKRLVADSDKLLALATSLHEDVSKSNKNVLSLDVIKRADEIERLAHAVKERMKQ